MPYIFTKYAADICIKFTFLVYVVVIPYLMWNSSGANLLQYINSDVAPGQILYILSKLFGLYAFQIAWAQICLMLLSQLRLTTLTVKTHIVTGLLLIIFLFLHVGSFTSAVAFRSGAIDITTIIPNFTHGFYKSAVSLGIIGFWISLSLVFSGFVFSKINSLFASWSHRLAYLVFILATIHAFKIGTEIIEGYVLWLNLLLLSTLFFFYLGSKFRLNRMHSSKYS